MIKFLSSALMEWKKLNLLLLVICCCCGLIYVGNTWSPSSYGYAFEMLGAKGEGLILGKPRPIRSDEYAVVTSLTQATVNNGFKRYNETSLYHEDLRINYALPLFDWGMLFKPTLWLYVVTNPAYAFSFHFFALAALFIFGYAHLFKLLEATPVQAFLLSISVYFTGFTQFWWNEKGPIFAIFPWVVVVLLSEMKFGWKLLLYYWVASCWLLENFYPPIIISLAFLGFLIILAKKPKLLYGKSLLSIIVLTLAVGITVGIYLLDYLSATYSTIYPGHRIIGGGSVYFGLWLSQWLPAIGFNNYESLFQYNICEIGTVGTYYALMVLCFLDYKWQKPTRFEIADRNQLHIFLAGLILMSTWELLPIPSWIGKAFLWDHVQPERMLYASGVLLLLCAFLVARNIGLKITLVRIVIFCGLVLTGWAYYKHFRGHGISESWRELFIVLLMFPLYAYLRKFPERAHSAILLLSCASGAIIFAGFNPLQSAWPIFNRKPTEITRMIDINQKMNGGTVVTQDFFGAILNGWGYRSVSHVTAVPKLDYWRKIFPELSAEEFNNIFNRYSHLVMISETTPKLLWPDRVGIPTRAFIADQPHIDFNGHFVRSDKKIILGGAIDDIKTEGSTLTITGWLPLTGKISDRSLKIISNPPMERVIFYSPVTRVGVAAYFHNQSLIMSGFALKINLTTNSTLHMDNLELCLIGDEPGDGGQAVLLNNPPNLKYCNGLQ